MIKIEHKRNLKYEFIRVIAMLGVIGVHVVGNLPTDTPIRSSLYSIFTLLFYSCNGIFFIISGKFALESRTEIRKFYCNKVYNLIMPMLLYMMLRQICIWYNSGVEIFVWKDFLCNVASGFAGTEYWFLYTLMGNLLLAPILRKSFVEANKNELWCFLCMGIVFTGLMTYLPYFGINFAWSFPLGGWTFYFYLGFCIERVIDSKIKENVLIVLGIICFIMSLIQKKYGYVNYIHDLAPTYIIFTCAIFVSLKRIYYLISKNNVICELIVFCGKHSFSIYMIHITVLSWVMTLMPFKRNYVVYLFGVTFLVAAISLFVGSICDLFLQTGIKFIKVLGSNVKSKFIIRK